MKRFYFALLTSALLLGACSNEDKGASPSEPEGLVFELSAVNKLNTSASRAPLYSQDAVQSVSTVQVYVFTQTGSDFLYLKTYDISNWTEGGTFARYEVPAGETLPEGTYKFLAVGTDNDSPYMLTEPDATTNFNDFSASIPTASNQELEIFAGSVTAPVVGVGARIPIVMTRQVAGVLGYFKNVPAEMDGVAVKYLRLTISSANKSVNLTTGIGSSSTDADYTIIDVDLSTQTVNSDGAYTGNDLSEEGVVKLANSQLNGAFLIPVNGVTMTLGLYNATDEPLKTWVVMDGLLPEFSILPNHFYSLGTKTKSDSTDGGGGVGSIPDMAIDLMTDQTITVTITPAWTLIHDLVII